MSVAGASDPAASLVAITKSDVSVHAPPFRALYVGGSGDVAVRMKDGTTGVFSSVPTGALLPISVDQVLSSGTSASLILGLR